MYREKIFFLGIVILLSTAQTWAVTPITVENFSFELPGTSKQQNWTNVPGWKSDTAASDSGVETGWSPTDGTWTGYLMGSDPAVFNLTNRVIVAGDVYELKIDAENTYGATQLKISLYYGDGGARTIAATTTITLTDANGGGQKATYTLLFSAKDVPASVGHRIGIELDNTAGGWAGFDNVRLNLIASGLPTKAAGPKPIDKATDVPPDIVLSWVPGIYASKHNVYFGTTLADVNTATTTTHPNVQVSLNQDANTYDPPGMLNFNQTYYWRVDEVNAPPTSSTVFKGDVWSFTVEAIAYQLNNVTATASSYMTNMGPEKTVDSSGFDPNTGRHGTTDTTMWLSDSTPQPTWIKYEFDKVYKLHEMWVWNSNQTLEPFLGLGLKSVKIEYSTDNAAWTQLSGVSDFNQAPGTANYIHNTTVNFGGAVAKYVRITANSNWKGLVPQFGLSEVRFFYIPVRAREPNPTDAQTGVLLNPVLRWRAGREAVTHKLYISTKMQDVNDGTVAPITIPAGSSYASYGPLSLDLGKTYYWKVNEVDNTTTWKGDVWSFSTVAYLTVEGFEDYNNSSPKRIFQTWLDGVGYSADEFFPVAYNGNGTGAAVGHDIWTPGTTYTNIMETTIRNSGAQSMPLYYDNTKSPYYSETERTLTASQNWTTAGIRILTLYFYGDPNNNPTEPLWVRLTDQSGTIKKITYGKYAGEDVNNLSRALWYEWNISLADFGVNSAQIKKIAIGLGNTSGTTPKSSGIVYIDDIRLYPAKCLVLRTKPTGDLNNDCAVDYNDVDILANAWLLADQVTTTTAPATTGLVGYWKFDDGSGTTAVDSSGSGNNGTLNGGTRWTSGLFGSALDFDGVNDYVDCGANTSLDITAKVTLSAWVKTRDSGSSQYNPFVGKGDTSYALQHQNGNNIEFFIYDAGAWPYARMTGVTSSFNGTWHHVAGTYDGSELKVYVDGLLRGTTAHTGAIATSTYAVSMGWNSQQTTRYYEGLIDEVRIYNRALSASEIAYLADVTPGDGKLHVPVQSPAELYSAEADGSQKVNFKDFAVLATSWLEEKLWP